MDLIRFFLKGAWNLLTLSYFRHRLLRQTDAQPNNMASIAGVTGQQYLQGTQSYANAKWQYATSSHGVDHGMDPALIVQPSGKDDIVKVLAYAKEHKIAVAIRSGGHQYSGASSTAAPNIQLDLQKTFRGPSDRAVVEKDGKTRVYTSVSWSLGDTNAYLTDNHVFVPHGQCTDVFVGGHVQTGGYGQLGRSFGLFGDHVVSLEVIDSDGHTKEITRTSDPDMFFALLGGSPGNLGVLTHFTIDVHRDSDHEGSRGLKALYWYDTDTLKRLVNILVEMSDQQDFPRNYDFCVSVLSSSFPLLDLWPEIDGVMRREHPEIYDGPEGGPGVPFWPRMIVVYAQWVPLAPGDRCDMGWFDRIAEGAFPWPGVQEKPMSQLTAEWIFRNRREFDHPYVKRTYATKSTTLGKDGWADWVVGRIDDIVRPDRNRCWLSAQLQYYGGVNSKFTTNAGNGTAYSWRDSTMVATLDCFHDEDAKGRAEEWEKGNDEQGIGPHGKFSTQDRRLLWGSYGDYDLDAVWNTYFEDEAKYKRLQEIRRKADPDGVFTPNTFCVKRAA